jgi:hypothetical protein
MADIRIFMYVKVALNERNENVAGSPLYGFEDTINALGALAALTLYNDQGDKPDLKYHQDSEELHHYRKISGRDVDEMRTKISSEYDILNRGEARNNLFLPYDQSLFLAGLVNWTWEIQSEQFLTEKVKNYSGFIAVSLAHELNLDITPLRQLAYERAHGLVEVNTQSDGEPKAVPWRRITLPKGVLDTHIQKIPSGERLFVTTVSSDNLYSSLEKVVPNFSTRAGKSTDPSSPFYF